MRTVTKMVERGFGSRTWSSKTVVRVAPGGAKSPAPSYRRSEATRKAIISAAEAVLVRHGHAGFTLKRVADAAGIAVGNLSYHFPTKDSLLERLVDMTLAEYSRRFDMLIPKDGMSGPDKLGELVEWFMDDSTASRYTHLFRELWAAALHSRSLNKALQRFYDRSIAEVLSLIDPRSDEARHHELELVVYLICVISEGSTVLFGARKPASRRFVEVKALARRAVVNLVTPLMAASRPR
jgi:AcrR family transcriptional regulator